MSEVDQSKLEEGSKPELSKEHKDGPNSVVRKGNSCFDLVKLILLILLIILGIVCLIALGWIIIVLYLLVLMILTYPMIASTIKEKGYLLVNVIAITVDPLFFYYPVLNDENKCIHFDKSLGITATVLRSFLDSLKLFHIISDLVVAYFKYRYKIGKIKARSWEFSNLCGKGKGRELLDNAAVRSGMLYLIDILGILPIPQVLVIFGIRGPKFSVAMTFFVVQYVPRVIRMFFLFTQGVSGTLADATWAIVAFYVFLYMQGGHVFGALWYYYAIEKATACWKKACINHTECAHSSFLCHDNSSRDSNFLNDFCAINTGNATGYNFGIFNDALQSRVVEETTFLKKLLHCSKWGLQNLSSFGQGLQTSNDVWENIFAICMTIFGVVLFVFLIGKMQSDTTKSQKINEKWHQITQWSLFNDIEDDVKGKIKKDQRKNWQNKRIKLDSLVSDLTEDTAVKVKLQFGQKLLKKVEGFKNWEELPFKVLCTRLKPVFFKERTHIIRQGDHVDEMIFVLKGNILTYSNASINDSVSINEEEKILTDGDCCGEELIVWAAQNGSLSNLPISTRNYQAYTDVEGFTLLAHDLKYVSMNRPLIDWALTFVGELKRAM